MVWSEKTAARCISHGLRREINCSGKTQTAPHKLRHVELIFSGFLNGHLKNSVSHLNRESRELTVRFDKIWARLRKPNFLQQKHFFR